MPSTRALLIALGIAAIPGLAALPAPARAQAQSSRDSAVHLVRRITFGPRPGDVDRVVAMGLDAYLEEQLHPERLRDTAAEHYVDRLAIMHRSTADLARIYAAEQQARLAQRRMAPDSARGATPDRDPARAEARRYAGELQQAAVARAVLSDRQLDEVMVDFWTNHFNVFLAKGLDRVLTPDYIERTIRPHALGRFADLLVATARSPAMLFYLDNAQSVAAGARPPGAARRRPGAAPPRRSQGINENYARELLELHTLGVDGGYTQQDVINVARIFTGWGIRRGPLGPVFTFNAWAHDRGTKVVLGQEYHEGGEREGLDLLRALARHPPTMRHVSAKLCARFVSDDPPDGCIDAAVHAWEQTDGDIRAVVRAIIRSPEFWAPEHRAAKLKTPLEFVVSAVRAVGGRPDPTLALAQIVGRLGEPLYLQSAPTGYAERADAWANSGALLQRFNTAVALAAGRLPGVQFDPDAVIPSSDDRDTMIAAANRAILEGTASGTTLDAIRRQVTDVYDPAAARTLVIGLALGSPEFQRR